MITILELICEDSTVLDSCIQKIKEYDKNCSFIKLATTNKDLSQNIYKIIEEKKWKQNKFIFSDNAKDKFYGLLETDFINIKNDVVILCEPSSIHDNIFNKENQLQFVKIGIGKACITDEERKIYSVYLNISGKTIENIIEFIFVIKNLFVHGGIVGGEDISTLLRNGILVDEAIKDSRIESASYNLHLGDQVHNGKEKKTRNAITDLSSQSDLLIINPYSYVVVNTQEKMNLPTFITARFDLIVSLFQQGLIMSASTQVDPGYNGCLTCLLYNTTDNKISIKKGQELLTIEYCTTTRNTEGYKGDRDKKKDTKAQLDERALSNSSNKLFSTVVSVENKKIALWISIIASILIPLISLAMNSNLAYENQKKIEITLTGIEKKYSENIEQIIHSEIKQQIQMITNQHTNTTVNVDITTNEGAEN